MPLSDTDREKILKNLGKMNEALAAAKQAIKDGDLTKATEQFQKAAEDKHLAISNLPELPLAPKLTVPFFPIYDVFAELDRLISELYFAILVEKNSSPKMAPLLPLNIFLNYQS